MFSGQKLLNGIQWPSFFVNSSVVSYEPSAKSVNDLRLMIERTWAKNPAWTVLPILSIFLGMSSI